MNVDTPLSEYCKGSKRERFSGFGRLGLNTIGDLLYHLPARYSDGIKDFDGTLTKGEQLHFSGVITSIRMRQSRGAKRMMMTEASIAIDGVHAKRVRLVWFHQPYIAKQYAQGDAVEITGTVSVGQRGAYITNPIIKPAKNTDSLLMQPTSGAEAEEEKQLIPIYPETKGISSMYLRSLVEKVLGEEAIRQIADPIPEAIRTRLNLPSLYEALVYIHRPRNEKERILARKRFIFEKVFLLQLQQQLKKSDRENSEAYKIAIDTAMVEDFMDNHFEFTPTEGQVTAVKDIITDINKNTPMARLLEGDVGSGKTAVAAAVMYGIVSAEKEEQVSGKPQVAYLAPTEILARQQFETVIKLFGHLPIQIGLITSKTCLKFPSKIHPTEPTSISKNKLKEWVANGEIAILVGTHAVIQKDISFKRLSLAVVDEQHRFGVAQRQKLFEMTIGYRPHLLSMTATPIPRTLALVLYGDLSISIIDTLPKERKPVKTKLLRKNEIQKAYDHIREEVKKGHQAYIICPLVDEKEDSHLRSVAEEHKYVSQQVFPDMVVEKIHGKMKPKEKQEIMERFSAGEIQILIATVVVEVGINVPNATIIAILHAERFGLAQLHQLRGRVIRSEFQPFCYAVTDSEGETTLERLNEFESTHSGFKLAEKDLEMRGSGELGGLKQSGIPDLVWEGLQNQKLLAVSQKEVATLVEHDPELAEHKELKRAIDTQEMVGD